MLSAIKVLYLLKWVVVVRVISRSAPCRVYYKPLTLHTVINNRTGGRLEVVWQRDAEKIPWTVLSTVRCNTFVLWRLGLSIGLLLILPSRMPLNPVVARILKSKSVAVVSCIFIYLFKYGLYIGHLSPLRTIIYDKDRSRPRKFETELYLETPCSYGNQFRK